MDFAIACNIFIRMQLQPLLASCVAIVSSYYIAARCIWGVLPWQIAWHEPWETPTSSAISRIVNVRSFHTKLSTWAADSSFLLVERRPKRSLLSRGICPSLKRRNHSSRRAHCCISKCYLHQLKSFDRRHSYFLEIFNAHASFHALRHGSFRHVTKTLTLYPDHND